ncbi:glycan biosynthesis hexose transferase WsfD [Blastococcus sp. SYSU D01042]
MRLLRDRRPTGGPAGEQSPGGLTGRARAAAAAAVLALTTAVVLAQLFVSGTVGLADNGDADRLVCRLGLGIGPDSSQQGFEGDYRPAERCTEDNWRYATSWRPVLRLTYWATRLVTGSDSFDVAVLAVVGAVLLGLGAAALFLALPGGAGSRWPLTALVVVAVSDIGFVTYLNSGYTDQAGFIGLLWVCAAVVGLVVHRTWPWLLLLAVAVVFTATAKTSLLTVVPAVALALLLSRRHWARRPAPARRAVPRPGIAVLLVLAVAGVAGALVAGGQGEGFSNGNKYNLLFHTILAESDDPRADLREMGLPPELAKYAGTNAWQEDTPWGDQGIEDNAWTVFSWKTYLEFFAGHPDRFLELVPRSFDAVTEARVDYLANLPGEAGGDPQLAERPSPVFWVLGLLPTGWPVPSIAFLWLGAAVLGVRWARSREAGRAARGVLLVLLTGYAVSQSLVALSDGYYELAKHNVHAAFATGLLLAVLLEAGARAALAAVRRRRAAPAGDRDGGGDTAPEPAAPAPVGETR